MTNPEHIINKILGKPSFPDVDKLSKNKESQAWDVYLNGKKIDTVFYNVGLDADYVKDGLVNHDGYDSNIIVKKGR